VLAVETLEAIQIELDPDENASACKWFYDQMPLVRSKLVVRDLCLQKCLL